MVGQFHDFEDEFKYDPIGEHFPGYIDVKREFKEIQDFIIDHNHKEDRQDYCDECVSYYHRLVEITEILEVVRLDLTKARNNRWKTALVLNLTAVFALAAVAAAVIIAIVK